MLNAYIKKILNSRVYDVAIETPLDFATNLSNRINNRVHLKREDLQPVFSFKIRGSYNKISGLSEQQRKNGVITASAGNHAQGVAMAAQRLTIPAIIVMPKTTPNIKVKAVAHWQAEIVLHGNTYDDAYEHAMTLSQQRDMVFVHPFDDPDVIAGQGTVATEILRQCTDSIDAVFVPVGGGGLIAGVSAYFKYLRPETKVIGVEPEDAPCLYRALEAKERVVLDQVGIFADGVAVRQVGAENFKVAQLCVDEVLLVKTDEICAAIKDIFDDTRSIAEPAGALAVAGLKQYVNTHKCENQCFVAIDSGANINFDRLRHVAERAELGEKREALLCATIDEKPGSFRKFCDTIGLRGITEFNYRYSDPKIAHVFCGIQMHGGEAEKDELMSKLKAHDYAIADLTDNEMAKLHIRYMVGGRTDLVTNERLIRFEFPERPGALLHFLNRIGKRWNISLFHYRNHGAAYGRVLVGVQVDDTEKEQFQIFLSELGYTFCEETDNPAYTLFLQ